MSDHTKSFCEQLADAFTDVRKILDEHLADYGELLPHVFFGDLTRYVLQDRPHRAAIVQQLEDAFASASEGIEELIAVSFVENIETVDCLNRTLDGVHGNRLRKEWESQHTA